MGSKPWRTANASRKTGKPNNKTMSDRLDHPPTPRLDYCASTCALH